MTARANLRLGVNIDHVATLRNARGSGYPDPVRAAKLAEAAGADGITAHLREDRRHIVDSDIEAMLGVLSTPLNLEMAATDEMQKLARRYKPHAVCIVPERREERTTEGGLDVVGDIQGLKRFIAPLADVGCRVSLFIAPDTAQICAAAEIGAAVVELHTGAYGELCTMGDESGRKSELKRLNAAASLAFELGLEVHAGHGLTYDNVSEIAKIPVLRELNIGHFLISEAVFGGLKSVISEMRRLMDEAREAGR